MEEEDNLGGNLGRTFGEAHDDVVVDAVAQREVADGSHRGVNDEQNCDEINKIEKTSKEILLFPSLVGVVSVF